MSIVTPSYNQAEFLEETIRSVLLQDYPNLEYIIIDGGSTDGSVGIIRKYEPWLSYWVSETDRGQSDALNKGFRIATGSIVAWLNSDDVLLPSVLRERVQALEDDDRAVLVYGDCNVVDESGTMVRAWETGPTSIQNLLLDGNQIPQPGTLIRASALHSIGAIDPDLHYCMDYTLWLRLGMIGTFKYLPSAGARFRHHNASKSVLHGYCFFVELLSWLSRWEGWDQAVKDCEWVEVLRRFQIQAALEAVLSGDESRAAYHFTTALKDRAWPYGSLDTFAQRIAGASGLGGARMCDSFSHLRTLQRALLRAKPADMSLHLWRRVASLFYMQIVFSHTRIAVQEAPRAHLVKGIWYDPRWLTNRGVWSICAEAFLGRRIANWLRRMGAGGE